MDHLYVLILAGGGGTRLWPHSREDSPKQFIRLFGGKSLFKLAVERSLKLTSPQRIFVSTAAKYVAQIRRDAKSIPPENVIGEPMRRETALAEGVGAAYIYHQDAQAVICNFPSDHLISPVSTFVDQMKKAARLAGKSEQLVAIGIKPLYPHPGMGHIRAATKLPGDADALVGDKFVEKPPLPLATRYTKSGKYYWNAHLFAWKADVFLRLLHVHAPKTYALLPKLIKAIGTDKERSVLQLVYQMAPAVATDYAVAEKLKKFICIPANFSWTDVGDWNEVWKSLPQDRLKNVIAGTAGRGEYIGIDSENNLLFLDKQLIATVEVKNMLIVDTPDAILICPKDDAQAVKKVVALLKEQGLTKYL